MKYIYITIFAVLITCVLALNTNIPQIVFTNASWTRTGVHSIDGKFSRENLAVAKLPAERKDSTDDVSAPVTSTVVHYDGSNRAWTFFAKVDQIKDVSIYG